MQYLLGMIPELSWTPQAAQDEYAARTAAQLPDISREGVFEVDP